MSRIFLSHSSANNAEAIALRNWLVTEGWSDLFLDLDPDRGIAAGERWERALNEAARRCEAVLFLISKAWLASPWCKNELTLARRLNKRLFGILIEETLALPDIPADVTSKWQVVNLAAGSDHKQFPVTLPVTGELATPTFSLEGLSRLKAGLQRAGLHASYFTWPPETDPKRAPYRGLRPLEADDAGIFFGREAPVIEAIDRLRGLTEAAPPRLMVILGASGAGKSSFLRAGLLPRLGRDPQTFLPLPVIRPERAAISGETGLVAALAGAFDATPSKVARGEIRQAIAEGAASLKTLMTRLLQAAMLPNINSSTASRPPTFVIPIDQGEELFLAEAQSEARPFLTLLRELVVAGSPPAIAVFTIRSDNYERLQQAPELAELHKLPFDLGPMPKGSYGEVMKGPIRRLDGTARSLKIEEALVDALLADIEAGGAKDALPLLAFTLERLYKEYGATGHLTLDHFNKLGRVKGSIEAAVERAFAVADMDRQIPSDRAARLLLLRRGLIPWLANVDPDTKAPRRRVAMLSDIPDEARPLIDLLVEQRLLSKDVTENTGEITIEPAHEALLRQWGLLQNWLAEDFGLLSILDDIKRAARDWAANRKQGAWLVHTSERLQSTENLLFRKDLAAQLTSGDHAYLEACRRAERERFGTPALPLGSRDGVELIDGARILHSGSPSPFAGERPYFTVDAYRFRYRLPGGGVTRTLTGEVFERPDAAGILVFNREKKTIVARKSFHLPTLDKDSNCGWMLETVTARVELGEAPEETVIREVEEETGYRIEKPELISTHFSSPSDSSQRVFLYYAEVGTADRIAGGGMQDPDELIVEITLKELALKLRNREIRDPKLYFAAFYLQARLGLYVETTTALTSGRHKETYHWIGNARRRIEIMTGSIRDVRGVDLWVNFESTDMIMDRFFGQSVSAAIRYGGAKKDSRGNVIKDTIADELRRSLGNRLFVKLGEVVPTGSGDLLDSNGVRKILHVATAQGVRAEELVDTQALANIIAKTLMYANSIDDKSWASGFRSRPIRSVLLPLIGSGVGGFTTQESAAVVTNAVEIFWRNASKAVRIDRVHLLAFTDLDLESWVSAINRSEALVSAER